MDARVVPAPARVTGKRFLLIQSRWMGDVLLCTPAIRAIRGAIPDAHISFLAEAPGADALRGNPDLDEILVLEAGIRAAWRLHRRVRGNRFDVVVDFRSTGTSARIGLLSGAPVRIGWRGFVLTNLAYTHLAERREAEEYVARQKLRLLAPLGIDWRSADPRLVIAPSVEDHERAERFWAEHALHGERVVAISPVSRFPHKKWSTSRWIAVADAIARSGARVLMASGPAEQDQLEEVANGMERPPLLYGNADSVREIAALYARCALWAGNDGGLKHVAAGAGIPTVSVGRWKQTTCWSDERPGSGQIALDAAPPGGCDFRCDTCAHRGCYEALGVDRVLHAVSSLLALPERHARFRPLLRVGGRVEEPAP